MRFWYNVIVWIPKQNTKQQKLTITKFKLDFISVAAATISCK